MATYVHLQGIHINESIKDCLVDKESFKSEGSKPEDFFANPSQYRIIQILQEVEMECNEDHRLPEIMESN